MPKKSDALALALAALAYFFVGFVLYGLLFAQMWVRETLVLQGGLDAGRAAGMGMAQLEAEWRRVFPDATPLLPMILGYISNLIVSAALLIILPRLGARGVLGYVKYAALLCVALVLPGMMLAAAYSPVADARLLIDAIHALLGFSAAAAVLGAFKERARRQKVATSE